MGFKEFIQELNGKRVEGELIHTIVYSLIASAVLFIALYFMKLRYIENFFPKYGVYITLAMITYALIIPSIRQVRAYQQFSCMSGMMIGMTVGMVAGFLTGYFIGATNGLFVGSIFGMALGIALGIWLGSCCGVMGFMEGVMAGFMSGPMGAMTAVMLLNEHMNIMAVIVFMIGAVILGALNYMMFIEKREFSREKEEGHLLTVIISLILTAITVYISVFGPRSPLFN